MNTNDLLNILNVDGEKVSGLYYDIFTDAVQKFESQEVVNYYNAAYGIVYADQTCRISGMVHWWVRKMTNRQKCELLIDIASAQARIVDVPKLLTEKYGQKVN